MTEVTIVEVGPRDGLQNEQQPIATADKLRFIELLTAAGLSEIEVTSFVHPKWVPQLADSKELVESLPAQAGANYSVLVPNEKGLERAIECGCGQIAVFTAASETFNQKNTNRSIADSLVSLQEVTRRALEQGMRVRGYLSTAFVCPYEGDIEPTKVIEVSRALLEMGIYEVSVSDTIGAAVPRDVKNLLNLLLQEFRPEQLALHFHDTYGTALANVWAGLELGITTFDSSAGGLGGCPYAPGAAGNLSTEDLIYLLDRSGVSHPGKLEGVLEAADFMAGCLGKPLTSRQYRRWKKGCS